MAFVRTADSDARLIERTARGDERAFEAFYRRYQGPVIGYHLRRTGGRDLAFDLAAETFAAVIASADRFDASKGSAAGWLFGIAANKLRKALATGRVEDEARARLRHEPVQLDDEDLLRVDELASQHDETELSRLLHKLPAPQRDAILARVIEERSYADIAAELECSEAVVRQRVTRGLGRLRSRMEGTR